MTGESARSLLIKTFLKLLFIQSVLIVLVGSLIIFYHSKTSHERLVNGIDNILSLHKVELLNEIALRDFSSLSEHLELIRRELDVDQIKLKMPEKNISADQLGENASTHSNLSSIFGFTPVTFDVASDFGDFEATIKVHYFESFWNDTLVPSFEILILILILSIIPVGISFRFLYRRIEHRFLAPLEYVTALLSKSEESQRRLKQSRKIDPILEVDNLYKAIDRNNELKTEAAVADIARMTAHDIRSPLVALKSVFSNVKLEREDQRQLVNSAIERINRISEDLLNLPTQKGKSDQTRRSKSAPQYLLAPILVQLAEEAKIIASHSKSSHIDIDLTIKDPRIVLAIDQHELKRVISNFISNAMESIEVSGQVTIRAFVYKESFTIEVQDNGRGIPGSIIPKLGQKGFSHDKESGSGLGLYSAFRKAESWKAEIKINSNAGVGTIVRLKIKDFTILTNIADSIPLGKVESVVIVDNEAYWRKEIREKIIEGAPATKFKFFTSYQAAFQGIPLIEKTPLEKGTNIYFIDHLLGSSLRDGVDLVDNLGISNRAFLITSLYDDPSVNSRSAQIGLKIIPKQCFKYYSLLG